MRVSVLLGVVLAGVAVASAANHPVIERANATLTQANGTSTHANGTFAWASGGDHALSHSPILRYTHSRSPIFDPGVRPTISDYNPTPKPVFSVGPYTSARPILMGGPYMSPNVSSHGTVTSLPSSSSAVDTPGVLPTMMAAGDEEPSYGPDYGKSSAAITPAPATKTVASRAVAADDEPSYAFPSYGDYPPDVFSDDDDFATGPPPYGAIPTDALVKRLAEHYGDIQGRSVNNECFNSCYKFFRKYCNSICYTKRDEAAAAAAAAAAAGIEARRNRNRYSKKSSTTDRYTDHYTEDETSTYTFPTTSAAPNTCKGCRDLANPFCKDLCTRE